MLPTTAPPLSSASSTTTTNVFSPRYLRSPFILKPPPSFGGDASAVPNEGMRIVYLNEPFEYDPIASQCHGILQFAHPMPHIIGMEKYFMLLDPCIIQMYCGQPIQCYVAQVSTVGIWRMRKEDVVQINSLSYDMARNKQLQGEIAYLPTYGFQQNFKIDAFTAFYTSSGRRVRRNSASITRKIIQDMEAIVSLRLSGLVQNIQSSKIEPIIAVHRLQVVRDDIEIANVPSVRTSALLPYPPPSSSTTSMHTFV